MSTTQKDRLWELLDPVASRADTDLEDITVTPAGKRRMLRVVVDADGGVDLDVLARVSREVSEVLDSSDVMGGAPYVLEVTTPGIDRPLTVPRHWRRAVSRLVKATLADGRSVAGRVLSADEDGADLDVDGATRNVAYADVVKAAVQIEFNRPRGAGPGENDDADPGEGPEDDEEA